MIGQTLAHYKILEKIGSGGMGDVYLARDTKLDREVALKVLPAELAGNDDRRARFEREAKALAALNHPGIVHVYSVEEAAGVHFITMELVKGKTLAELIPPKGFPVDEFFGIAIPLADAMAAAHQEDITHRDLKPDNVMVSDDSRIKVLDFGLAKPRAGIDSSTGGSDLATAQRTEEGRILGTIAYMSPEQAEGKLLDARSDIFSLGVLFYQMLTGERPFRGDTAASTLSSILKDTPRPITEARPSVPRELGRVVNRCLAKSTTRRFQTALDVRNELEEVKDAMASGELAVVSSSAPGPRWTLAVGVAALVVLAVALGYYLGADNENTVRSATPQLTNSVQITADVGVEDYPSWSPDGRTLAYHSIQDGDWDIWVTQIGGGQAFNRTADYTGSDRFPVFSPDGTRIAFYSSRDGGGCFVVSALGGRAQKILASSQSARPQWSGDGDKLACAESTTELAVVSIATLESEPHTLPHRAMDLAWSANGRLFAYIDGNSYLSEVTRLWVLDTSTEKESAMTDGLTAVWSPSWSSDGTRLYYVSNRGGAMDLWQQSVAADGSPIGDPERVTTGIGVRQASFSPDETKLAYARGSRVANVWRVPILSDRLATWDDARQITFDQAFIELLDISPDGERLFVSSDRTGNQDLWTLPADGGEMERLTSDPTPDWAPRVSPDGERIVFYSYRTGNRDLWLMPSGGGPPTQLTDDPSEDQIPQWSPDGSTIVYQSRRGGFSSTWTVSVDGGEPRRIAEGLFPRWSPDGEWIYSMRGGVTWRTPAAGGESTSVGAGVLAGWSKDGSKTYVYGEGAFWETSPDGGGTARKLTELAGRRGGVLIPSPDTDGRYIYFAWQEDLGDIWVMDVVTDEDD